MTDRPILFSAPMVRSLLAGTKTQTRRVAKHPLAQNLSYIVDIGKGWFGDEEGEVQIRCPYGQPGDRLWVRETWAAPHGEDARPPRAIQCDQMRIHYAASEDRGGLLWRPSIHMPRWASRITLEVTGVRVERLQDISEADAMAEGVQCDSTIDHRSARTEDGKLLHSHAVDQYRALWESSNGPGSWEANPWVWVVEFKGVAQ